MTEEETFRKLCKPNFHEMESIWSQFVMTTGVDTMLSTEWPIMRQNLFKKYDWNWDDFFYERQDRLNRE